MDPTWDPSTLSRFTHWNFLPRAFVPSLPLLVPSLVTWHDRLAPRRRRQSDSGRWSCQRLMEVDGVLIPMDKKRLNKKNGWGNMFVWIWWWWWWWWWWGRNFSWSVVFFHSCCFVFTVWRGYEVSSWVAWVLSCLKSTDYNNMLQFGKASKSDMQPAGHRSFSQSLHSLKTTNSTYMLEN